MTQGGKGNKRHILVEKDIIFKTNGLTNIKTIQKLDQVNRAQVSAQNHLVLSPLLW